MLILTRKVNETIQIGDSIRITVTRIDNANKVRLGVDAPKDVRVLRDEVYNADNNR